MGWMMGWVRVCVSGSEETSVRMALCYRPPKQGEEVVKAFFKQLKKALGSETIVFMEYFNLLTFSGRARMWDANKDVSGCDQG